MGGLRFPSRDRRGRVDRRMRLVARALIVILLFAYAESYFRLSRRGMSEAEDYWIDGFLYVPCARVVGVKDARREIRRHYALLIFFAPLNLADRVVFGGPAPCVNTCFMTLSG